MDDVPKPPDTAPQMVQGQAQRSSFNSTAAKQAISSAPKIAPVIKSVLDNPDYPAIIAKIEKNTQILVDAILERLKNAQAGQKIIVDFAEIHDNGTHVTLLNNVLDQLVQRGKKCAVALEWPPNNIDIYIDDDNSLTVQEKESLKSLLHEDDFEDLRDKLSCDTTPVRTVNAPLSRSILHEYMDQHDIPVFCSDAARDWARYKLDKKEKQHLLTTDDKTLSAIHEALHTMGLNFSEGNTPSPNALKKLGMLSRNIYTSEDVLDRIEDFPEIEIIFIDSGRAHMAGNDNLDPEPSPYEHGLSYIFKQKSPHAFIGAPIYASKEEEKFDTPKEALKDPDILNLDYMVYLPFNTKNSNKAHIHEDEYINAVKSSFPWMRETLNGKNGVSMLNKRTKDLYNQIIKLRDDFFPRPEAPSAQPV